MLVVHDHGDDVDGGGRCGGAWPDHSTIRRGAHRAIDQVLDRVVPRRGRVFRDLRDAIEVLPPVARLGALRFDEPGGVIGFSRLHNLKIASNIALRLIR